MLKDRRLLVPGMGRGPDFFVVDGHSIVVNIVDWRYIKNPYRWAIYRNGKQVDYVIEPEEEDYVADPTEGIPSCHEMVMKGGHFWCLIGDASEASRVYEYERVPRSHKLRVVARYDLPRRDIYYGIFALGDNIEVLADEGYVLVAGPGPADTDTFGGSSAKVLVIDDGPVQVQLTTRHYSVAELLARTADSTYFWVKETAWEKDWKPPPNDGHVYQFDRSGKLLRTFTLPGGLNLGPRGCVAVGPDGSVYYLRVTYSGGKVLRIEPNP